jgi:hypothetical protein
MERENRESQVPSNDPSKAMDSKKEVENSNDKKTDQDFPGYPHYPAREDIMDQRTDTHRVDLNVEELAAGPNASGVNQRFADDAERSREGVAPASGIKKNDEIDLRTSNEFEATPDELQGLDSRNEEIGLPQNVSNEDLDSTKEIPGTDLENDKTNR